MRDFCEHWELHLSLLALHKPAKWVRAAGSTGISQPPQRTLPPTREVTRWSRGKLLYHDVGPWHRKWQPTPTFLPGKSCGWESLISYSPGKGKRSDTPEQQRVCTHCTGGPVHPLLRVLFLPSLMGYSGQWPIQLLGARIKENSQAWRALESVPQGWTEKPLNTPAS